MLFLKKYLSFYTFRKKKRKENITALEFFLQDMINLIQLKKYNFICVTVEETDIIFNDGVFTHFL